MKDHVPILKQVALFKGIHSAFLETIAESAHLRRFADGEVIIREGERGKSLFILLRGEVTVTKKMTLLGDEHEVSQVDKALIRLKDSDHAFFGEMAMCDREDVRSATVTAQSDCTLLEIPADAIESMVREHADFGAQFYCNLATVLAERLRKANRDILKLTTALTLALES